MRGTLLLALVAASEALVFPLSRPHLRTPPRGALQLNMGARTAEQLAAFPAAKDTKDFLLITANLAKNKKLKALAALCLASTVLVFFNRRGWLAAMQTALNPVTAPMTALVTTVLGPVIGFLTNPDLTTLAKTATCRVLTRLIDWGVPAAVFLFVISVAGGSEGSDEDDDESGGVLKKLLKGDGPKKAGAAPAKTYIQIESLGDKLNSMAYSITASTTSTAEATRAQRQRDLSRRFGDDLGDIGVEALDGLAAAEVSWRAKVAGPAAAAAAARAEIRAISVKLGGESSPRSTVGADDDDAETPRKKKALEKKLKRAHKKLAEAQMETLELESSFLTVASEALGEGAWEKRAALAKLVASPLSWDPTDVPLPHNAGLRAAKRAFVLDFEGDTAPAQTSALREEVTAIVNSADPKRGDTVILRLISGGGSVTGYGLAMAQLLRLKSAGLHLTVCVEQVAASGGYMMACVADRIVASPFAVLGSIGVITQIPNVYERLTKEGVVFQTVTAGEFKRTLTPYKKIDPKDVEKTEEEIGEIFSLFKNFVGKQRPSLDIDKVATGETWFGEDALEKNLADALQTYDDLLLELHNTGVEIYGVTYKEPAESPLAKFGISSTGSAPRANWLTRVAAAALGLSHGTPQAPYGHPAALLPPMQQQPHFRDPRY